MRLHRRGHPKPPYGRDVATGGCCGRGCRSLFTAGKSLVALHDWTRQLGPGFVVGVGNGLMLGYLMYRSRLMPRGMAMLGLIGGPLIIASGVGVLLGIIEAGSVWQGIATIPEFSGSCRSVSGSPSRGSTHLRWLP
jgi:hypothetical protein